MRRFKPTQRTTLDGWEMVSVLLALVAAGFAVITAFLPVDGVEPDGQLLIVLVGAIPATLALQRRLIVERIEQEVGSRLVLRVLDNNLAIWSAYQEALQQAPDRGIVRLINGYHNYDDGRVVTGPEDDAFFDLLAARSRAASASGGNLGVRLLLPADLPGIREHAERKVARFRAAGVAGQFEIRTTSVVPPLDLLLNAGDAVIMDVPEVYGHPVQGTGFDLRSAQLHGTLAGWYDKNYWNEAGPMVEASSPRGR